ncbi:DUF7130 family rubredoxin-like protein [Natronorubrum halalkaliphilum]|uniref:DUF7130 family rubredoxin-like protein n=1 Tax=Natronorubrum halalkaliphilum TaxID=2691917 RepID=UPI003CCC20E4
MIGRIRGFDEEGFHVTLRDGLERLSIEHVRCGDEFGEAHVIWRCLECGEMGGLHSDLPDSCSFCGTVRETSPTERGLGRKPLLLRSPHCKLQPWISWSSEPAASAASSAGYSRVTLPTR